MDIGSLIFFSSQFERVKHEFEISLAASPCNSLKNKLAIAKHGKHPNLSIEKLGPIEKEALGEFALQIYFFQIFYRNHFFLDLSPKSFLANRSWAPKPLLYRFSPDFLIGIRKIYTGLFLNQMATFKEGLNKLRIEPLEQVILHHFKNAQTEPILFTSEDLKSSAKETIVLLLKSRIIPTKDFIAFGIYLNFLYQTLSKLDIPIKVYPAFNEMKV